MAPEAFHGIEMPSTDLSHRVLTLLYTKKISFRLGFMEDGVVESLGE